jgi:hypothetical protein
MVAVLHFRITHTAQVVTRHGSRTRLEKNSHTLQEGGSTLTMAGQMQLQELGSNLREDYFLSTTSGEPLLAVRIYAPFVCICACT